ncbi:MAG: glutathione S-transferase family protein [Methyloligellaceae bacterium]
MIKLYWCPRSRAARAMWMLEEIGADYEVVTVDIRDPAAKATLGFRMASPMGKVPALADGDVMLSDSAAICLYLADRFPDAGLAPAIDEPLRARYLYWMVFTPGVMEPAMAEKFGGWETNPVSHGWGDYDSMLRTLEAGLTPGPWLLGERFSAADILVGSSVHFMNVFGVLPDNPTLKAYEARCLERPAYQCALARDEAAVEAQEQ